MTKVENSEYVGNYTQWKIPSAECIVFMVQEEIHLPRNIYWCIVWTRI